MASWSKTRCVSEVLGPGVPDVAPVPAVPVSGLSVEWASAVSTDASRCCRSDSDWHAPVRNMAPHRAASSTNGARTGQHLNVVTTRNVVTIRSAGENLPHRSARDSAPRYSEVRTAPRLPVAGEHSVRLPQYRAVSMADPAECSQHGRPPGTEIHHTQRADVHPQVRRGLRALDGLRCHAVF